MKEQSVAGFHFAIDQFHRFQHLLDATRISTGRRADAAALRLAQLLGSAAGDGREGVCTDEELATCMWALARLAPGGADAAAAAAATAATAAAGAGSPVAATRGAATEVLARGLRAWRQLRLSPRSAQMSRVP